MIDIVFQTKLAVLSRTDLLGLVIAWLQNPRTTMRSVRSCWTQHLLRHYLLIIENHQSVTLLDLVASPFDNRAG